MVFAALSFALADFAFAAGACSELQILKRRVARLEQERDAR